MEVVHTMAFKSVKTYNEERFGGLFLLRNDGDFADVIFLYRSEDDVLVADTHYIKSADYSGYVHCCGRGCPACQEKIRVQTKLFIPLYNIDKGEIQFFDRTVRFEPQLHQDVFEKYPDPSEFVFRITRHGAAGDVNTTYEIQAIAKNTHSSYEQILADNHASFPEYYKNICRDVPSTELHKMINSNSNSSTYEDMPSYQVTPRGVVPSSDTVASESLSIPDPTVDDSAEILDDPVDF